MNFGRRSIRKKGYDYSSSGCYFVTLCTYKRERYFGSIKNFNVELTTCGRLATKYWNLLPTIFKNVELDSFVVMPNHIHGIIRLGEFCEVTLGSIIQNYKSVTARKIAAYTKQKVKPLWQRNYYEHIIRNEKALNIIRLYILLNPRMEEENSRLGEMEDLTYEQMEQLLSPYMESYGQSIFEANLKNEKGKKLRN